MECKAPTTASTVPNHTLPHKHTRTRIGTKPLALDRVRNQGRRPSHVPGEGMGVIRQSWTARELGRRPTGVARGGPIWRSRW